MKEFSISNSADQQFSTIVNDQRITLRLWYARSNDRWSFDLSIDNNPVLHGRKIVTGVDLLAAFNFGIGVFFAHSETNRKADRSNLSDGLVKFYHVDKEELYASISS